MRFSLALSTGSSLRKNALAIFVSALAIAGAAAGFAQSGLAGLVFPESSTEDALNGQPIWAGGLALGMDTTRTPPDALTSASYLLPAENILSAAPPAEPACPKDASCLAKAEKLSRPPRKPQQRQAAAAPVPAKRQLIALATEAKPAGATPQDQKPQEEPAKSSGWLNWSKISDRLPKTDALLKPFNVVSDAVSGLMKRF